MAVGPVGPFLIFIEEGRTLQRRTQGTYAGYEKESASRQDKSGLEDSNG